MHNVVVTGIGMITPLGGSRAETFEALLAGRSGISAAPPAVTAVFPGALAGIVDDKFRERLGRTDLGLDRATALAMLAVREAVEDAAFDPDEQQRDRIGVFSGIGLAGAHTTDTFYNDYYQNLERKLAEGRDPTVTHPLLVSRLMANAAASNVSIEYRLRGPTQTYSVACSSSAIALGEAYLAVRDGRADAIVVVGSEAMLAPGPFMGWKAMRVMAKPWADDPSASFRPFDRQRSGFVLSEGAAAVIVESAESARRRGASIYGRICGYGATSDASHITLPSQAGQSAAMRRAIEQAGLPGDAIGYVNAHGTATVAGDVTETASLRAAFGRHADQLAVSSTKSMHGHLIGACGALEFAISLMALRTGMLPPTANLDEPDERCDLDYIPGTARHLPGLQAVMSNTFAFGGSNVSLIATNLI